MYNTIFATLIRSCRGCISENLDWLLLKYDLTFDNQIKLIDMISCYINGLIFFILLKLKALNIIADFLAKWIKYRKSFNNLCHFIKIHSACVNIFLFVFRTLNLNENGVLSKDKLGIFMLIRLCEIKAFLWYQIFSLFVNNFMICFIFKDWALSR